MISQNNISMPGSLDFRFSQVKVILSKKGQRTKIVESTVDGSVQISIVMPYSLDFNSPKKKYF